MARIMSVRNPNEKLKIRRYFKYKQTLIKIIEIIQFLLILYVVYKVSI